MFLSLRDPEVPVASSSQLGSVCTWSKLSAPGERLECVMMGIAEERGGNESEVERSGIKSVAEVKGGKENDVGGP